MARAAGRLRGRQPKPSPRQEAHLAALHATGDHTPGDLAHLFDVGRSTAYRALARASASATSQATTQKTPATTG